MFGKLFSRYLIKQLAIVTITVAMTLAMIILLTQSLRFLEMIIESGASSTAFIKMSLLALPRFFEVVLPIGLAAAVLFVYNRMTADSEIVVFRSSGMSPSQLTRPALTLAILISIFLFGVIGWVAPLSLEKMHELRQIVKAQYSALLFRPGVFTPVGKDLTVYVRDRGAEGSLAGIVIHDRREKTKPPVTIVARKGTAVITEQGPTVVLYNGVRQQLDPETAVLSRLSFTEYSIDMPEKAAIDQRWKEPDERTLTALLNSVNDAPNERIKKEFIAEIHRRLTAPFLSIGFALASLACLLLGPLSRRGQALRITLAIVMIILLQGLYLGFTSVAKQSFTGVIFLYISTFAPAILGYLTLSSISEPLQGKWLYGRRQKSETLAAEGEHS